MEVPRLLPCRCPRASSLSRTASKDRQSSPIYQALRGELGFRSRPVRIRAKPHRDCIFGLAMRCRLRHVSSGTSCVIMYSSCFRSGRQTLSVFEPCLFEASIVVSPVVSRLGVGGAGANHSFSFLRSAPGCGLFLGIFLRPCRRMPSIEESDPGHFRLRQSLVAISNHCTSYIRIVASLNLIPCPQVCLQEFLTRNPSRYPSTNIIGRCESTSVKRIRIWRNSIRQPRPCRGSRFSRVKSKAFIRRLPSWQGGDAGMLVAEAAFGSRCWTSAGIKVPARETQLLEERPVRGSVRAGKPPEDKVAGISSGVHCCDARLGFALQPATSQSPARAHVAVRFRSLIRGFQSLELSRNRN